MQSGRASTAQLVSPTWRATAAPARPAETAQSDQTREGPAGVAAERLFCEQLLRLGVEQLLDLGGSDRFGAHMRHLGYAGALFSLQPNEGRYRELLARAQADPLWFPLARQGAGSSAHFTQLDHERVFMQPTDRLLRSEVMQGIEALRIDAQVLGIEALDGYRPLLDRIRLILIEAASAAGGASSLAQRRDEFAQPLEALGFERLTPHAAPGDQGGCVMSRAALKPRTEIRGVSLAALVTSIGGTLERRLPDGSDLGPLWLQSCMHSWQRTAAAVVSVAEREPPHGIRWARTQARPSLAQMLAALPIESDQHLLLTNADIVLTDALPALLPRLHGQAVYYGSRLDVERGSDGKSGLVPRGIYEMGFDFFVLPQAFVRAVLSDALLLPEQLRIGEPWWDYLLPLLALALGFPLKKLNGGPVLAMHYLHPSRYSTQLWLRNREHFIAVCSRLLGRMDCHATGVISELLAHLDQIPHLVCRCLP